MGTALFTLDALLDAAESLVAEGGPPALTIERLTKKTGASNGSIYHRFGSRSVLTAQLWVRAVRSFHSGFAAALEHDNPNEAALDAALHTVRWSRKYPSTARMLLLSSEADLVAADLEGEWRSAVTEANQALVDSLKATARRLYGSADEQAVQRVGMALIDLPRGAVHRHLLARRRVPAAAERFLAAAVTAVLTDSADPSWR
jgi:AcrR family transcriptional regulator